MVQVTWHEVQPEVDINIGTRLRVFIDRVIFILIVCARHRSIFVLLYSRKYAYYKIRIYFFAEINHINYQVYQLSNRQFFYCTYR